MLLRVLVIFVHICLSQEVYVIARVARVTPIIFPSLTVPDYDNTDVLRSPYNPYPNDDDTYDDEEMTPILFAQKRGAINTVSPTNSIDVCETTVLYNHEPKTGTDDNGETVEVQQDSQRRLITNFVSCANGDRPPCHAIDKEWTSECVTVKAYMPAGVRPLNDKGPFRDGNISVPIRCACSVHKKKSHP